MTSADLDTFLREHRSLVVNVLGGMGGHVVKEIGDAYLVTFESSTAALLACVELQRQVAVAGTDFAQDARAEIRIAVAAGDVLVQNGDVFGTPVNTAARVETVTPPGEIYLTEAVYQNVNRNEVATQFVREFSLKGLGEPVRVYRTTFRHQTRAIRDAGVLMTDIAHFSEFAKSASPTTVEDVFDWWERGHREVAGVHGGVVRVVNADAFTITFDEVNRAVEAWLDLYGRSRTFNAVPDCPFAVTFRAGVDSGDIRIFRSALYGRPLDGAAFCCRHAPIDTLAAPTQVMARLGPKTLSSLGSETGTIPASDVSRAQRAGVDSFMILKAR